MSRIANQATIVKSVMSTLGITQKDARKLVAATFGAVGTVMKDHDQLTIKDVFTIRRSQNPGGKARGLKGRPDTEYPAKHTLRFRPHKGLLTKTFGADRTVAPVGAAS